MVLIRWTATCLLLIGWACTAWSQPKGAAGEALVDSALALPYNDMVRDLPASEGFLREALVAAQRLDRENAMGHIHRSLSIVIGLQGSLDSATHHSLRAAEAFRASGDRLMLGLMLCDMGHGTKRRDLDQAFAYYREGLPILEELNARQELTRAYNNFSMLFEMRGDIDSALYYGRKGLALKEALHDSTGLPYGLNRVALYLLHRKEFDEAQRLMLRADSIRRIKRDEHGLAEQELYFGDLYQAWGRVPEAIAQFSEAVHAARAVRVPYMEQYAQERLAELHEAAGDAGAALAATRRAYTIKDSLFNDRNSRTMIEMEKRYELARKDQAIAELQAATSRRNLVIGLSLGAMVVLVVGGLLAHQVRQRRLRAERDAAIIREREAGLKAVFEATEEERRRLARELHDGVGQQLGGLKHRLEHLRTDGSIDGLQDTIGLVDDTAREVRDLAHQLMPKALSRVGLVPAITDLLDRTFKGTSITAVFDHLGVPEVLPADLSTGVYRIVQELVGNIIKHAHATAVEVQLLRNKGHVVLIVQDNGRGLVRAEGAGGLGLTNIADRTRALGGTFAIEAAPGHGTVATIRVPLPQ